MRERLVKGDAGARDRCGARAAVGFDDIAIEENRAFAKAGQIDDASKRTSDEPLNLERPPPLSSLGSFTVHAFGG